MKEVGEHRGGLDARGGSAVARPAERDQHPDGRRQRQHPDQPGVGVAYGAAGRISLEARVDGRQHGRGGQDEPNAPQPQAAPLGLRCDGPGRSAEGAPPRLLERAPGLKEELGRGGQGQERHAQPDDPQAARGGRLADAPDRRARPAVEQRGPQHQQIEAQAAHDGQRRDQDGPADDRLPGRLEQRLARRLDVDSRQRLADGEQERPPYEVAVHGRNVPPRDRVRPVGQRFQPHEYRRGIVRVDCRLAPVDPRSRRVEHPDLAQAGLYGLGEPRDDRLRRRLQDRVGRRPCVGEVGVRHRRPLRARQPPERQPQCGGQKQRQCAPARAIRVGVLHSHPEREYHATPAT